MPEHQVRIRESKNGLSSEAASPRHMSCRHRLAGGPTTALLAILLVPALARADYPIVSHRYLADPGSLVHGGRIYLYTSNDDDNAVQGGYTMHSVVCVSTADLKNWTDHGIVFQVPADASWAQFSWAPQPVEQGGQFFLYFGDNTSGVGVASSTSPTGEFADAKGGYLVNGATPGAAGTSSWLFDPGVLIDDDGQAYLSFGGNGADNPRIIKLGSDLASVSGSAAALSAPGFFEASFLFKRNGIYYFSYSTNPSNGQRIDYMTSGSPLSGYTYRGVLAGQPPLNSNNNQASEFVFNGQWYHAYHNRSVSTAAGISTTFKRNLGIEALDFNADGTIQPVTYTTDGVPQVGRLDPYVRVEAETMNAQSGIETETCSEGGMDVTQINDGDWIRVRGADFGTAGATGFSARVATSTSGGSIALRLGSPTGTLIGTCSVPATGGPQTWMSTTCAVTGAKGIQDLYLTFKGSASPLFNFDYWQFSGGDVDAGGTGSSGAGGSDSGTDGDRAVTTDSGISTGREAGTIADASVSGDSSVSGGDSSVSGDASSARTGSSQGPDGSGGTGGPSGAGGSAGAGGAQGGVGAASLPDATAGGAGRINATPDSPNAGTGCGCLVGDLSSSEPSALVGVLAVLSLGAARRRSRTSSAT